MNYRQKKLKKTHICALMRDVLEAVYHFERVKEERFGITYELYYALTCIQNNKKVKISDIASKMGIPMHKATRIIQRLHAKGLIQRGTHDEDKRIVYVALTKKGRQYTKEIEHFCYTAVLHNIKHYSDNEIDALLKTAMTIPYILTIPDKKGGCHAI